jgi:hypothetical protein
MKHIKLEVLGSADDPPIVDYAQLLRDAVRKPLNQQQGADIAEMRQSIRVLDALDSANGVLELEDADWRHLKEKLAAMPWAVIDRRIVQLVEDVENAE